jgi:hypothetical protein
MKISWNYVYVFYVLIWCEVSYLLMLLFVKSLICSFWIGGRLGFGWCCLLMIFGYVEVMLKLCWGYVEVMLVLYCCSFGFTLLLSWCYVDVTLILFWWLSGFEFVQLCLCKCAMLFDCGWYAAMLMLYWGFIGDLLMLCWCHSGVILISFWCHSGAINVIASMLD